MLWGGYARGEIVMDLVCGKHRGTTQGFMVVRLVILAIIMGLAELFTQEVHAARSYLRVDAVALLRDGEATKNRPQAYLRTARRLSLLIVAMLLGPSCLVLVSSPWSAAGAAEDSWWVSRREPAITLAESIYRLPIYVSVLHTAAHPDDENNA